MKVLYVIIFISMSSTVLAQSYMPFPDSNAVLIQASFRYFGGHEHETVTDPLSFGSDSILGGVTYHTLHGHSIVDWADNWGNQQTYQSGTDFYPDAIKVLFRQDIPNKLIYQWDINTNQEQVLYDFNNLIIGQPYPQTLNNMDYPQILVMASDSVLLNDGLYHERWVLGSNSIDSGFVSIIEGMGSTMGFNLPIAIPFEQSSSTLCFNIDGNSVFDGWADAVGLIQPRYSENCEANVSVTKIVGSLLNVSVWPNPVLDIVNIKSSERIEKLVLYDLLGQKILEQNVQNAVNTELSLADLPAGNYLLKVYMENNQHLTRRIVR